MYFSNFHLGEQISKFTNPASQDGGAGGFTSLSNVDVHSELGIAQCGFLPVKDGDPLVTEDTIGVVAPDASVYLLSKTSGKIWRRSNLGVYQSLTANVNATGHVGGGVYGDKVFYATATKLGKFNADTALSRDDNFGTFEIGSTVKPFLNTGIACYFGDDDQVASVTETLAGGTFNFNDNAIDSRIDELITDLAPIGDDIAFSSYQGNAISKAAIRRWNQIASSYFTPDYLGERGISMLISSDSANITFAISKSGKIYYYTGAALELFHQGLGVEVPITPYNKCEHNGQSYFAVGDSVYTIHRVDRNVSFGLNKVFTCSQPDATISSLFSNGDDLMWTWGDGSDYGVDRVGTDRATAVIETTVYMGKPNLIRAYYDKMPSGCSMSMRVKCNDGNYTSVGFKDNARDQYYYLDGGLPVDNVNVLQAEITIVPNGSETPTLTKIIIE